MRRAGPSVGCPSVCGESVKAIGVVVFPVSLLLNCLVFRVGALCAVMSASGRGCAVCGWLAPSTSSLRRHRLQQHELIVDRLAGGFRQAALACLLVM